jgi:hypothetical protein
LLLAHWTGIYFNGQELGFRIFQEVVRRLHARFDHLLWMRLSEVARYWAAKELTRVGHDGNVISFRAPFACPEFTVRAEAAGDRRPKLRVDQETAELKEVSGPLKLSPGSWCREGTKVTVCFALPKGASQLELV